MSANIVLKHLAIHIMKGKSTYDEYWEKVMPVF